MAINRDKILREAEKLVQKGKIEQAIREYEKLLQANPNDANTINRVGDLYGRIGQVDRAIELYERIADHFTEDGFTTKAIAILKKINRLAPQRLDIFSRLAELYIQQGLVVESKSQYQILADWYVKNGDAAAAIEAHRKLVQLDPDNHMANLRLADLLVQNGNPEEAAEVYDRLGRMLLERDKFEEAERLYRHALGQGPVGGDLLIPLIERLLDAGRNDHARTSLAWGLETAPGSRALRGLDVRVRIATGDAAGAMQHAEELLKQHPDDRELRLELGRAMLATGEAVAARDMMLPVADHLLRNGDFVAAQKIVQELLRKISQDRLVLETAVRAFRPSNDQQTLATLSAGLADCYFRADNRDGARRLYVELLEIEPGNRLFRHRLAQLDGRAVAAGGEPTAVDAEDLGRFEVEEPEVVEFDADPQPPAPSPAVAGTTRVTEVSVPPAFDSQERLAEANVFAKYGLVDKAIHHLEQIVMAVPDHYEAREKLVLLYLEENQTGPAIEIAGPLVQWYRSRGDADKIEKLRARLPGLDLEGSQPAADHVDVGPAADDDIVLEIDADELIEQGPIEFEPAVADEPRSEAVFEFEMPEIEVVELDDLGDFGVARAAPDERDQEPEILDEPIELLEIVADDVIEIAPPKASLIGIDEIEVIDVEAPPMRSRQATEAAHGVLSELDALERSLLGERARRMPAAPEKPAVAPTPAGDRTPREDLVEISDSFAGPPLGELQQLDFFIQQELFEDAVRILTRLEDDHPGDSELGERRLRLKSKGVLLDDVPVAAEAPEDLFADEDEYIDLAAELEEELAAEEAMVDEATGRGKDEALLEEVFREFQKGVAEQLSEEDSDTHFNLGIAYKEMGLLPEAIREFQISSRDPEYFIESCSMIGVCYIDQGMPERAAEWYGRALGAPNVGSDAAKALRYDLASSLESAGEVDRAHQLFEEIYTADAAYRDVSERLAELSQHRQAN